MYPHLKNKLLNPVDLEIVKEKVDDAKYKSLAEFMADILLIQHNYRIAFRESHFSTQ